MSLWATSKAADQVGKDAQGTRAPSHTQLLSASPGSANPETGRQRDLTGAVWGLWGNPLLVQFVQLRRERWGQPSTPLMGELPAACPAPTSGFAAGLGLAETWELGVLKKGLS